MEELKAIVAHLPWVGWRQFLDAIEAYKPSKE
jgi:hypothetical protein